MEQYIPLIVYAGFSLVVAVVFWLVYSLGFDPYGLNSRLRRKRTIKVSEQVELILVEPDAHTNLAIAEALARQNHDALISVGFCRDLIESDRLKIPVGMHILSRENGKVILISRDYLAEGGKTVPVTTLSFPPKEPESLEGYYIGIVSYA